ncbi:MAG: F0F1 ATP synthase subunit B [Gammaproteobacteria bacterium]|nr:F0F1 ATP synthase subunit B [Gammaproteobacteria bacterium]
MNINMTLLGQTITFALFIWFTMKFVWPPIMNALHTRRTQIADGLAAAEKAQRDEELSRQKIAEILREAKTQAQEIMGQAEKRAAEIIDSAKSQAKTEAERIVTAARAEIEQNVQRAREQLRGQVATLAVAGASRVLKKEINAAANEDLLKDLVAQL